MNVLTALCTVLTIINIMSFCSIVRSGSVLAIMFCFICIVYCAAMTGYYWE